MLFPIDSISKTYFGRKLFCLLVNNCFSDLSWSKMGPIWAFTILLPLERCHLIYTVFFHLWQILPLKYFAEHVHSSHTIQGFFHLLTEEGFGLEVLQGAC